jgi:hypothetical protein
VKLHLARQATTKQRMHLTPLGAVRLVGAVLGLCLAASWTEAIFAQPPEDPPLCHAYQLEVFFNDNGCSMGRCYPTIDFRNASEKACTLPADTSVTALNRRGTVMGHERPRGIEGSMVLQPGDFGEYRGETYNGDMGPGPPLAETYLFRFAPDDRSALRAPGAQVLDEGPVAAFSKSSPPPDLSKFPQQTSRNFTLATIPWLPLDPDPHHFSALSSIHLHVSVANHSEQVSAGWKACRVIIEASEEGSQSSVSQRSVHPCDWNGDLIYGAIAAGATVAMETVAKLPKVCHLARYAISVKLEQSPIRFAPLVLQTSPLQPECDDAQTIPSSLPALAPSADLKLLDPLRFGLPVDGIRIGLEIPTRFPDPGRIGTIFPGDPVIASVWIENGRDTPLHLTGPHGFHLKIASHTPLPDPRERTLGYRYPGPVELVPRTGSGDTGPIDTTVPPHTKMNVVRLDLGAQYDFPVERLQVVTLYPNSFLGEDEQWNWTNDHGNAYALQTFISFRIKPSGGAK